MGVWLAPGEGLLLDRLYFDSYNNSRDCVERIQLNDEAEAEVEHFKKGVVYKEIVRVCHETDTFDEWLVKQNGPTPIE